MRVLRFEKEEHDGIYTMLAQAARSGEAKGIEVNRRVAKLLDKLDSIGESHVERVVIDGEEGRMTVWELAEEEATVVLDDAIYDELVRRVEGVPWNANASRRVVALDDFLKAAPTELDENGVKPERKAEGD